ncbi:MAG: AzlD domain-containing protein [Actinobacteria bacterium]|nr:AzlD domain-containing protein [Actinomycetota bacterium]
MSWTFVFVLAGSAYFFKVLGLVVVGDRELPPVLSRCLALIPAALLAGIVVHDTFNGGRELVLDARALGVGAAALAAWRKVPLIGVIVIGAAVTAAVRALG